MPRASSGRQGVPAQPVSRGAGVGDGLPLDQFQPKSMLHVTETRVARPRFPVIDMHTHLTRSGRSPKGTEDMEAVAYAVPPADVVAVMERKGIATMVNLTGGRGAGLEQAVREFDRAHPGRFITFTEPWWSRASEPGYREVSGRRRSHARTAQARAGVKVLKTLGLYLREAIATGRWSRVDDPRFDPMWEACAALSLPVAIHVADPEAFFLPIDRFNERIEELHEPPRLVVPRPRLSADPPSFSTARNRVFARHPRTTFVALHVGHHAEDLADVAGRLDRFPNMHVELGRQDRRARAPAAHGAALLRALPGPDPLRDRRRAARRSRRRSRCSGTSCTRSTTGSWRPRTSTSTTRPRRCRRRDAGESTGWACRKTILKKVYHDNAARLLRLKG